jgi:UDP-N-acetylglucosamine 2-epimerase (non-hydrolysing)
MLSVHLIAAVRPNFMKVAPLFHVLAKSGWCKPVLVQTGQHYDFNMSDAFFQDLGLPEPDYHLGVGSGSHAEQTAGVMVAYEKVLLETMPDWVIVVGDVNSTIACTLAAKKLCLRVAHLEAGLRSRDWAMPEEINRMVTDAIADVLWTPSQDGDENLLAEGVAPERISFVGNIMIDSYELLRDRIEQETTRGDFGLEAGTYGVVTLHRPSNVDHREALKVLVETLTAAASDVPLVFALHPRTKKNLEQFDLYETLGHAEGVHLSGPLSYIRFMGLVREAKLVITDSGGIQEETTYLGIPCLTLRDTTERPVTISEGSNCLATTVELSGLIDTVLAGEWPIGKCPDLWDGNTAVRVMDDIRRRSA